MSRAPQFKSERREQRRSKARHTPTTSRAFLLTLDRLAASRDRAKIRQEAPR